MPIGIGTPGVLAMGYLLGCAAQLQQPRLWPGGSYLVLGLVALAALAAMVARALSERRARTTAARPCSSAYARLLSLLACLLVMAACGWASTGLRAVERLAHVLPSALEGRDLQLVGRIDSLPQAVEGGLKLAKLQGWLAEAQATGGVTVQFTQADLDNAKAMLETTKDVYRNVKGLR